MVRCYFQRDLSPNAYRTFERFNRVRETEKDLDELRTHMQPSPVRPGCFQVHSLLPRRETRRLPGPQF